jgi:hypothetical protein
MLDNINAYLAQMYPFSVPFLRFTTDGMERAVVVISIILILGVCGLVIDSSRD